jgi:ATP-binding cassette subfamily F protein uup
MPLITFQDVDFGVGGPLLLEKVSLSIEPNERVCIVGRNGAGKSTLLRLIAGEAKPDDGEVRRFGSRIAGLAQEVPASAEGSIFDVVSLGLGEAGARIARYHHLLHDSHEDGSGIDMEALGTLQETMEQHGDWSLQTRVEQVLTRLDLPEDAPFASLSGGMKRRVLLAQALVAGPDLLLLDEPTNHLDIASIAWLEEFLRGFGGSVVFVTHDRAFLRSLATRIIEIDRGQVTSWPGDYDNYLRRREERLHAEAQANSLFDKKLAQEEVWIRQGIKARRTRNEGRVTALKAMRRERSERRAQVGNVRLEAAAAGASGKRVIEAKDLSFAWNGRSMVKDFSTRIQRGDKIGLIGANGSGKTTLLRLLLGDLQPDAGEVKLGTNLDIVFFDQLRGGLREDWNVLDNLSEGREFIEINGARKHALGYLQDFLFTPDRARAPITALSGGERNRLLLARLFARQSNLLVMDEPTNDLDVETLELLEERLGDYPGTLLLVSHDRDFLDSVVTSTLVLEGDGRIGEFVGGYSDWLRQRGQPEAAPVAGLVRVPEAPAKAAPPSAPKKKLTYKDQRELDLLPARIDALESRLAELGEAMQSPDFYARDSGAIAAALAQAAEVQKELDAAYARWNELDA